MNNEMNNGMNNGMNNEMVNHTKAVACKDDKKKKEYVSPGVYSAIFFFCIFTLPQILSGTGLNWDIKCCFNTPDLFTRSGISLFRGVMFELPFAGGRWLCNTGFLPMIALLLVLDLIVYILKRRQGEI